MKNIPVFTTEYGVASLTLREIPYRNRAYIKIQSTSEPDKLMEECVAFCRACGAEWISAAGDAYLEQYPLITEMWLMTCNRESIGETDACLFPMTEATVDRWLQLYNQRMADVPNAAYLDSKDGKEFLENGDCYFVSYRDPNLQKTVEVYENTSNYLRNFVADERTLTQYIIGTVSEMDSPMSPAAYGAFCLSAYLSDVTEEMIQKDRDEVLNVTQEDIRRLAEYVDAFLENNCICVVGTAPKIEESKELFDTIDTLFH